MLTDEQSCVVAAVKRGAVTGGRTKVIAGAGTGKTSTLYAVADALDRAAHHPLYLAYNRAIMLAAREKFGARADVMTLHSLAYRALHVGSTKRRLGQIYPSAIAQAIKLPAEQFGLQRPVLARMIVNTLSKFLTSSDLQINKRHVPGYAANLLPPDGITWVVKRAQDLFAKARPGACTDLSLPHDLYLKTWQTEGAPGLHKYSVILFDEAQDANPVVLNALSSAHYVVFVGDPNQQIYSFRGAVDAMNLIDGEELPLTRSFRWGEDIARVANKILFHKRNPPKWPLRGNPMLASRVTKIEPGMFQTRLYRTNNDLMEDAFMLQYVGKKPVLIGDRADLAEALSSAKALRDGNLRGVRHHLFRQYESWDEVMDEADAGGTSAHAQELNQVVKLALTHESRLSDFVDMLRNNQDEATADVILSTAHRAKGREWNNVVLTQDFDRKLTKPNNLEELDLELNLLYVAATRARFVLDVQSETLAGYLRERP